jgi:hypothetical protein
VCRAGRAVAGIQWDEVLDVGGDESAPGAGGVSEDLLVGSTIRAGSATTARTSWPLARKCSAMAPGNISFSSSGQVTVLAGEQLAFSPPGVFSGLLGC